MGQPQEPLPCVDINLLEIALASIGNLPGNVSLITPQDLTDVTITFKESSNFTIQVSGKYSSSLSILQSTGSIRIVKTISSRNSGTTTTRTSAAAGSTFLTIAVAGYSIFSYFKTLHSILGTGIALYSIAQGVIEEVEADECDEKYLRITVGLPSNYAAILESNNEQLLSNEFTQNLSILPKSRLPTYRFKIQLEHVNPITEIIRNAFDSAAERWSRVITLNHPELILSNGLNFSCANQIYFKRGLIVLDDLLIFTRVEEIDGVGQVLGSATPCLFSKTNGLPRVGIMRFDVQDMAQLQSSGTLGAVILHEMGHVLGIGTIWSSLLINSKTVNVAYTGKEGKLGFSEIMPGSNGNVPVENTGGIGTRDAHWRESIFDRELMTGYVDSNGMPLSRLTVRSLADLGYTVNIAEADLLIIPSRGGRRQLSQEETHDRHHRKTKIPLVEEDMSFVIPRYIDDTTNDGWDGTDRTACYDRRKRPLSQFCNHHHHH